MVTIDDVETGWPAETLTEEQYREWLRDAFRPGASFAVNDVRQGSKELARLLISKQRAKKRALNLLRRFITPAQWQDYNSLGCFSQKDGKGRTWKFSKEHHYPIECDGQPICIDAERGAPDEDLLLQVWLEVIGGRGEELAPIYSYEAARLAYEQAYAEARTRYEMEMVRRGLEYSALGGITE